MGASLTFQMQNFPLSLGYSGYIPVSPKLGKIDLIFRNPP